MTHESTLHPGSILNVQFLREKRMTRKEFSEKSGIPFGRVGSLICGRARVRELDAYRLALVFKETTEDYWIELQSDFDSYRKLSAQEQSTLRSRAKKEGKLGRTSASRGLPIIIMDAVLADSAEQNLLCVYRDECLQVAARRNSQGFSCDGCDDVFESDIETEMYASHHLGENHSGH